MAAESKTKSAKGEKAAPPPPSRRSGRLAGTTADEAPQEPAKKRAAADDKPTPASKKAKPTPAAPASKPTKSKASATSKKAKAAEEEKEAEAEPEAEPSTDGGKAMKEGDKLPKVTLKNEEGEDVAVADLAGVRGVVIFLYPKANTPGCTNQACGFRDAFDEIAELGYDVYGLSRDGPTAQKNWKVKQKLNYSLLCDPDSVLIKRLGAFVLPKNTKRSHFIFEKGSGKLVEAKYSVKPADDPGNCLKFIKAHHK